MNFCTQCGNQLKPDARFCGNCGENIRPGLTTPTNFPFHQPNLVDVAKEILKPAEEFTLKNSQRRIVNLWIILGAFFIFLIFFPSIIGLDGFDGGFAISFVSGFMVLSSLVVIFIYRSRAKQLDKILSGEGRIAVWKYTPKEWERFTTIDFEEEKKVKKQLFFLVSVICVVIGIIMLLIVKDILILFISLAIIPMVAIPAFLAPRARFHKLSNSEPKAIISEKGVVVGKMFHLWIGLGATLDQVVLAIDENPPILEFHYSMPTRTGRQEETARIPVPAGKVDEANRIVEYFSNRQN